MSTRAQRVVVIQDASRDLSSSLSTLRWALDGLLLKPGDGLTLLGVLRQVTNSSMFPFKGARKLLGYKKKVGSSFMSGMRHQVVTEEVARKEEEYQNTMELLQMRKLYEINQIDFRIIVKPATSSKAVAVEVANELRATWVVLDRQMKKDKKYFIKKLSCGISRMKSDNNIEQLRGPKWIETNITLEEMVPGTPSIRKETMSGIPKIITGNANDDEFFSLDLSFIRSPNTYKKKSGVSSSSEELQVDNRKEPSFSTSTSSTQIGLLDTSQSPNSRKNEASLGSCFGDENKNHTDTQRGSKNDEPSNAPTDIPKTGKSEVYKMVDESEEPSQSCICIQDSPKSEFADLCFKESFETPKCPFCKNGRQRIQRKRDFTYAELEIATGNFSKKNFLSEGRHGSVYKGQIEDGQWIAVKQLKDSSLQGEKEFKSKVQALTRVKHRNVVRLLGSCSEGNQRLLVNEFVCNGSLEKHLSYERVTPLDWSQRMRIALGTAKGLKYLHQNGIIHRDMRPSNILLTHDYEPMLGNFGHARIQQNRLDCSSITRVGIFGYWAPEYAESGKVSLKTDVYSFGVVMLELITGQRTIAAADLEGDRSFLAWVKPLLEERKYHNLIDHRIFDLHDVYQLFGMVYVAENCLKNDPTKRPSMKEVVHNLKCIMRGESVSEIGDFLASHSDFISSITKFLESEVNTEKVAQENRSTEISSISSKSLTSEKFSMSSSAKSSFKSARRCTSSSNLFKTANKSNKEKRIKSRSQSQLPYDDEVLLYQTPVFGVWL